MENSLIPFVGITGGIGSGKSTICRIFSCIGIPVFEADVEAKILISTSLSLKKLIIQCIGNEAYDQNGYYNREFVKKLIIQKPNILTSLNSIIHPAVREHAKIWHSKNKKVPFALYESAILTPENKPKFIDQCIVVTSPLEDRIKRLFKRNPEMSLENIHYFISNQPNQKNLIKLADFIIDNSLNACLWPQITKITSNFGMKI